MQQFISEIMRDASGYLEIREIAERAKKIFMMPGDVDGYRPAANKNIYIGIYDRVKGNGKAAGCISTKALWADYDAGMAGLTVQQRANRVRGRIRAAGLPDPSIIISSGNGIHAYWLLNERQREVSETLKAIALVTGADARATDKARIMRLPGTFNVKDRDRPLKCEILQADYSLIYDLRLFNELLKDYISQDVKRQTQAKPEGTNGILNIKTDRACITSLLAGVPEGERNFALGRLTKWLQIKGYTRDKSKKVILAWNEFNDPPEDKEKLISDFNQFWHGDYKLLGCSIKNPELQQVLYKHCNRPECKFLMTIGNMRLDNMVRYNNRLLNELHSLTGNCLIVYGLLMRHREGLTTSLLIEKLTSKATGEVCISKPTRLKVLSTLEKLGFIEVIEGNQRAGRENLYKARPQGTYGLGYTLISNGAINGAIDGRVTPGELRLYVLLLRYAFNKGACYPSLNTLAKDLRITPQAINYLLRGLEKADYIKRVYRIFNEGEKLDIRLLV